jgi:hypothetical protein
MRQILNVGHPGHPAHQALDFWMVLLQVADAPDQGLDLGSIFSICGHLHMYPIVHRKGGTYGHARNLSISVYAPIVRATSHDSMQPSHVIRPCR